MMIYDIKVVEYNAFTDLYGDMVGRCSHHLRIFNQAHNLPSDKSSPGVLVCLS
jgi:hypothetical protein